MKPVLREKIEVLAPQTRRYWRAGDRVEHGFASPGRRRVDGLTPPWPSEVMPAGEFDASVIGSSPLRPLRRPPRPLQPSSDQLATARA